MAEREPGAASQHQRRVPRFGEPIPQGAQQAGHLQPVPMFSDGSDLPIFSGTPIPIIEHPFVPQDHSMKQGVLPGMPGIDYEAVLAQDKALRRRRQPSTPFAPAGDIFTAPPTTTTTRIAEAPQAPPARKRERGKKQPPEEGHLLREALAPYISLPELRRVAALGEDLAQAFISSEEIPPEVLALLEVCKVLFQPVRREQIKSPEDLASLLMLEMGYLDQEQMRVACLNTKNRLQTIHTIYQGNVNTSVVRVGEIFREPLRRNSTAIILAHNHPSGEPEPSPEDLLVTRQIVAAGKLLDIELLDHLIIAQGRWVSLRQRGLGFTKD
jgi:DNA repair protein RadC